MKHKSKKSVEPIVADLVNGWLKSYRLDYKLEQDSLNSQIDTKPLMNISPKAVAKEATAPM